MLPQIGWIGPVQLAPLLEEARPGLASRCQLLFLPCTDPAKAAALYRENQAGCQGFVFSNPLLYHAVLHRIPKLERYCGCLSIDECDLYRTLFQVAVEYPTLDFAQVLIGLTQLNLKMNGIFPEGHSPVIELSKPEKGGLFPSQEEILARYRQLCRRDDLKLIITQLFALEEPLARAGIPCRVVHPSQESIQQAALDVLSHLKAVEMDGALTVSGVVSALDELDDLRKTQLSKALRDFNKLSSMVLVIRRNQSVFELTTSNARLSELTAGRRECRLTAYLKKVLEFEVCVGWGVGRELASARKNASQALLESRGDRQHRAFILDEKGILSPPLESETLSVELGGISAKARALAKRCSISSGNMQKILSIAKRSPHISSEELAYYLGVEQRSASRILNHLVDAGAAELAYKEQINLRGRPAKIYLLNLDQLEQAEPSPSPQT